MDENQNPAQPTRPQEPGPLPSAPDGPPQHPGHANYGIDRPGAEGDGATEVLPTGSRGPAAAAPGSMPAAPPAPPVDRGPRNTAVLPDEGDPAGPQYIPPAEPGTGGPGGPGGPDGPDGPGGSGGSGGSGGGKRSTGKLIGLIAVAVVALLVIVLAGSELFLRNRIESCIADQVKSASGATDVDVSLSKKPMLLQWAAGSSPSIDIDIPNLQGTDGMSAHLYLKDVQASGDNRIGSAVIVGGMSKAAIGTIASKSLTGATVTLKPDASQIDVTGKFFGLADTTLTLNVKLVGGKLNVTATNTQVDVPFLGKMGIPDDLVNSMVTDLQDMSSQFPKGLKAQSLTMTDDQVNVTFSGTNVLPKDLSNGTGDVGNGCSVL